MKEKPQLEVSRTKVEIGVSIKSFEGGQMPLYRRLPKEDSSPLKIIIN